MNPRTIILYLILLAIAVLLSTVMSGCAYAHYRRDEVRVWTLFKDYTLRDVRLTTNGLAIGSLIGDTDNAAIEGAARGAAKGAIGL